MGLKQEKNRAVWLTVQRPPKPAGPGALTLRDLEVLESVGPDAPAPNLTGDRSRHLAIEVPLDGPGQATLTVMGSNAEDVPVKFHVYHLLVAGYALYPDDDRTPDGGQRILDQLAGQEPGPEPVGQPMEADRSPHMVVDKTRPVYELTTKELLDVAEERISAMRTEADEGAAKREFSIAVHAVEDAKMRLTRGIAMWRGLFREADLEMRESIERAEQG